MKLLEILHESIDDVVYRNMGTFDFWYFFLRKGNDILEGYMEHKLPSGKVIKGTSFTRNYRLAQSGRFGQVLITADRTQLAHNNQIVPIDAEYIHYLARRKRQSNDPVARRNWKKFNDRADGTGTHEMRHPMAEEFVVGDIRKFSRCIKQIDMLKKGPYQKELNELLEPYQQEHNIKVVYHY